MKKININGESLIQFLEHHHSITNPIFSEMLLIKGKLLTFNKEQISYQEGEILNIL